MPHRLYTLGVFAGLIVPGIASADVLSLSQQLGATDHLVFFTPNSGSTTYASLRDKNADAWAAPGSSRGLSASPHIAPNGTMVRLSGDGEGDEQFTTGDGNRDDDPDSKPRDVVMFHSLCASAGSPDSQSLLDNLLPIELLSLFETAATHNDGTFAFNHTILVPPTVNGETVITGTITIAFNLTVAAAPAAAPEPASLMLFGVGALLITAPYLKRRLDRRMRT
jgi:hypothetical protein